MGGEHFRSNAAFVQAGINDVQRLESVADLSSNSRLLDWGCGAGRLFVGVVEHLGSIQEYHGVDVQRPLIQWAQKHLATQNSVTFSYVNIANARYNPGGDVHRYIPGKDNSYDVFYAYSVFSHMRSDDTGAYMHEMARLLAPNGKGFFTAFVEDAVEDEVENPSGYGPLPWSGSLHCVRYERRCFRRLVESAGLRIIQFEHGRETDGQSLYLVTHC